MSGLPRVEVLVDGEKYSFHLLPGKIAYLKLAKYGGNFSKMITSLLQGDTTNFNKILDSLIDEKEIVELFETFVEKRGLMKSGDVVNDIDTEFAGRASSMYKLLFEAIKANDKDFFTSLPTLIESLVGKLTEKLQANSLQNQSGREQLGGDGSSEEHGESSEESWLITLEYLSEEEKFFLSMATIISRQYHIRPSEIEEEWTLNDMTLVLASIFDEAKQNEKLQKQFDQSMKYNR